MFLFGVNFNYLRACCCCARGRRALLRRRGAAWYVGVALASGLMLIAMEHPLACMRKRWAIAVRHSAFQVCSDYDHDRLCHGRF